MQASKALSGVAGAAMLTGLNYLGQQLTAKAPQLDALGRQAVRKSADGIGAGQPSAPAVQATGLTGNLATNSLIYSLAGVGRANSPVLRGALVGAAMGAVVVLLAPKFGYGRKAVGKGWQGKAMAIGEYVLGGATAGMAHRLQRTAR